MVRFKIDGSRLMVESPYHPSFPAAARRLGGTWDDRSRMWSFDVRDESRVRELTQRIYGEGGENSGRLYTVRLRSQGSWCVRHGGLYWGVRELAHATGRDSGARLGPGVVLLQGGFGSGGSRANWTTDVRDNTVVELKDVPEACLTMDSNDTDWEVLEAIEQSAADVPALSTERIRLLQRIAEIDQVLSHEVSPVKE